MAMERTPELGVELSKSQLTAAAAAWHVLGFLLSQGRPVRAAELAYSLKPFYSTPEFIRFLCSIPNSPLRLVDNHFVTFSHIGVAAIARFFANSDLITRYLDLQQLVPPLLPNFRLNGGVVRTYCRKRKRPIPEADYFSPSNKRSCFQNYNAEKNSNQMVLTVPSRFQSAYTQTQGIETLSSLPSRLKYDWFKPEKSMPRPIMFSKSRSRQFSHEIENVEHESNQIKVTIPNTGRFVYLHGDRSSVIRGGSTRIHYVETEELINSVPLPVLLHAPCVMANSDGSRTCDFDIVNPINSINICTSSKSEVDEQMILKQENGEAVIERCESLPGDVNGKLKEISSQYSVGCKDHEDNRLHDGTDEDRYPIDKSKTLRESNNKALFLDRSKTVGHLQSQRDMLNDLIKHSSIPEPDHKCEASDRKESVCSTMKKCECHPDKGPEEFKRHKHATPEKQTSKFSCGQDINIKEKKETSMENRRRGSSIHKNVEKEPFPDFESFIVEEEEGSGGYGTVFRARRKADGIIFAIKCPHVNANRNYVTNEIKMLERLGGRNFVIKYEGSFKNGSADCLVLEHIEHDRPEILKREMNVTDLLWYGYCLFRALSGLHKQGIVHRDVKPGNFLYSRKVNKGYLIDFNLALDMRKKYGSNATDTSKARHDLNDPSADPRIKSPPPAKSRRLMNTSVDAVDKTGRASKSLLPPGNLKKKVDKAKLFTDANSRNIVKSQCADGSGITSTKDATSTKTVSAERLREPLPNKGRRALLCLAQEAMQGGNHESVNAPKSKRKRVAAPAGDADSKILYTTPMPLHANGISVRGAGSLRNKGDGKTRREGPCVGTKGFKAPEVLFRSLHQGPKADIWSAGVTLLYLIIGRSPFTGDTDQNIKEIAKLRGSEDLWEVAKLHNNESLFPQELLDVKHLSPIKLGDWCAQNTKKSDLFEAIPTSLFDLVDKCLTVNPRQRITAEEALRHEFFTPCHEAFRRHRLRKQGVNTSSLTTS